MGTLFFPSLGKFIFGWKIGFFPKKGYLITVVSFATLANGSIVKVVKERIT